MPNLSTLSRGTQLLVGAGVLLLIDTFLAWQSVDVGPFSASENAWSGFWGVIMGLALLVLLAWVIARVFDVKLPDGLPEGPITLGLGVLIFVFALLKNLIDDYSTLWSYIGILLAAGVAYGAWLRHEEAGGSVESLRASLPTRETPSTSPAAPAEPSDPTPPPPSTPQDDGEARRDSTPGA